MKHVSQRDLYIVRGLPGAGKTALVESLCSPLDKMYSPDDYMVDERGVYAYDNSRVQETIDACQKGVEKAMQRGVSRIFVHALFTKHAHMQPYFKLASRYGYRVFSCVVERHHNGRSEHFSSEASEDESRELRRKRFDIRL